MADGLALVTGATGYIGGRLVPRLLQAGHRVRCLAREPSALEGRWPGAELVRGDCFEPDSLAAALEGCSTAYYLVHSMSRAREDFVDRDRVVAANFGAVARAVGVRRVVYLGGLGHGDDLSPHLRSRHEVGDILRSSGVPVVELQAGMIVGSGSASFEMLRYTIERTPVIPCAPWLSTRSQPIAIRDVLSYLIEAARLPGEGSRTFELGGPEVLTYLEVLRRYARARGLWRLFVPVPWLPRRLAGRWAAVVSPVPYELVKPLAEGTRCEAVVHDPSALQAFSVVPITFDDAVLLALERLRGQGPETNWFDGYSSLARTWRVPPRLRATEGMFVESWARDVEAPAPSVFAEVCRLGGDTGWLAGDWLWRIRGLLDLAVGGPGMRLGRRHPDELRVGDPVDFWRVEALEPDRRLRLRAEMRVPGRAWLEFEVAPRSDRSCALRATAFFEPRGLLGAGYWWACYPLHRYIFDGMFEELARRAALRSA